MNRITEINVQLSNLREELYEIQSAERDKQLRACVGKYFKYRNCYSCPEGEQDRWWLYAAVYLDGKDVKFMSFQTDKDGKFEFDRARHFLSDGWIEIPKREFAGELKKARKQFFQFAEKALGQSK